MRERIIATNADLRDKTFLAIKIWMVEKARAPAHVEFGTALGIGPDEALIVLDESMPSGYPAGVDEDDNIVTTCPLSNQPNQYRISVDGEQKWFGQLGIESLAVYWLFPGKSIRIDAVCPDCGEPIVVEMSDGDVLSCDP